jgi:CYTH domain-containing protein
MPTEIERKFLVASDDWKKLVTHSVRIRDGLVAASYGHKVRVRIAGHKATITVKGNRTGLVRPEIEYEIPISDAEEMMRTVCDDRHLEKDRHYVPYAGFVWEIDVYDGLLRGVVIAEIELDKEDRKLELPDWVGKEVTNDPRYRKINMEMDRRRKVL